MMQMMYMIKLEFRFLPENNHLWKYLEFKYQNWEYIHSGTDIVKDIQMQSCIFYHEC